VQAKEFLEVFRGIVKQADDIKYFYLACQNVCVLKKKKQSKKAPSKENSNDSGKDVPDGAGETLLISLNKETLKEMLLALASKESGDGPESKHQTPQTKNPPSSKLQQEIVFLLLDELIA